MPLIAGTIEVSFSGMASDVELASMVEKSAMTCLIRSPMFNQERLRGLEYRVKAVLHSDGKRKMSGTRGRSTYF